jgi:hypothetical protein
MSEYLENLRRSIEEHQRIIDAGLPEAAQAEQIIAQHQAEINRVQSSGSGGPTTQQPQQSWEERRFELDRQDRVRNVTAAISAAFTEFGLASLIPAITRYAQQGYDGDAIAVLLRDTPEYKARFPAMSVLAQKGRAISEAAYVAYERNASAFERQYGLPQGMLMNNLTNLIGGEVSLEELNERVQLAASASINAPEVFKEQFRNFYGVDALTAYFLDPSVATPLLQKQVATAEIGEAAARQNINIELDTASQLQELGISREGAVSGFQQVARMQPFSYGRGDTLQQPQAIQAAFGTDQEAIRTAERAQLSRAGRFQGGGGFAGDREGVTGLGSSAR